MPLEATMIVVDNSEYMRNGDYPPSRYDAQSEAATKIFTTKIDSNPESSVGIMTLAGKAPEVLVTHSKDLGQMYKALHTASKVGGVADFPTAIAVARLALKIRPNKNLRQRIIVFIGSQLEGNRVDEKSMKKLAKDLKKNNVAVDVVAFGDGIEEGETSILKLFVSEANSGDNSHYLTVPPGPHLLSDIVSNSPILAGDRNLPDEVMNDAPAAGSTSNNDFDFGVDPSLDPELAMALRMSMEEERARQAAVAGQSASAAPATAAIPEEPAEDEEADLKRPLLTSQEQDVDMEGQSGSAPAAPEAAVDDEEEEAIARAIEMSMKDNKEDPSKKS